MQNYFVAEPSLSTLAAQCFRYHLWSRILQHRGTPPQAIKRALTALKPSIIPTFGTTLNMLSAAIEEGVQIVMGADPIGSLISRPYIIKFLLAHSGFTARDVDEALEMVQWELQEVIRGTSCELKAQRQRKKEAASAKARTPPTQPSTVATSPLDPGGKTAPDPTPAAAAVVGPNPSVVGESAIEPTSVSQSSPAVQAMLPSVAPIPSELTPIQVAAPATRPNPAQPTDQPPPRSNATQNQTSPDPPAAARQQEIIARLEALLAEYQQRVQTIGTPPMRRGERSDSIVRAQPAPSSTVKMSPSQTAETPPHPAVQSPHQTPASPNYTSPGNVLTNIQAIVDWFADDKKRREQAVAQKRAKETPEERQKREALDEKARRRLKKFDRFF